MRPLRNLESPVATLRTSVTVHERPFCSLRSALRTSPDSFRKKSQVRVQCGALLLDNSLRKSTKFSARFARTNKCLKHLVVVRQLVTLLLCPAPCTLTCTSCAAAQPLRSTLGFMRHLYEKGENETATARPRLPHRQPAAPDTALPRHLAIQGAVNGDFVHSSPSSTWPWHCCINSDRLSQL